MTKEPKVVEFEAKTKNQKRPKIPQKSRNITTKLYCPAAIWQEKKCCCFNILNKEPNSGSKPDTKKATIIPKLCCPASVWREKNVASTFWLNQKLTNSRPKEKTEKAKNSRKNHNSPKALFDEKKCCFNLLTITINQCKWNKIMKLSIRCWI